MVWQSWQELFFSRVELVVHNLEGASYPAVFSETSQYVTDSWESNSTQKYSWEFILLFIARAVTVEVPKELATGISYVW